MIHQYYVCKGKRTKRFVIQIPRNMKEANELDLKNGNTKW